MYLGNALKYGQKGERIQGETEKTPIRSESIALFAVTEQRQSQMAQTAERFVGINHLLPETDDYKTKK